MPKTHRNRPPTYPIGVLPEEVEAEPSVEVLPRTPPAASATKSKWVDYAAELGIDVAGLTKAQIRKAVA